MQAFAFEVGSDVTMQRYSFFEIISRISYSCIRSHFLLSQFFSSNVLTIPWNRNNTLPPPSFRSTLLRVCSIIRPLNINWQDWKNSLFVAFICHIQISQGHNELSEYRLSGGRHRKHWIKTPISKLSFKLFYHLIII